ncbi:MAG: hypothetical protein MUE72_01675, partial [Chitinophagaceae bacterium]|nr:hypothetical protein [Chitinophagaceae bacterium]
MKKIILACLLLFVVILGVKAQFLSTAPTLTSTPTDGTFGSYGNATPWFMGWDDNYLYIGKTGGSASESLFVYLDIDPNAPSAGGVSGGSNANGSLSTTNDNGVTGTLPFRADIKITITPTVLSYQIRNGSGGWAASVDISSSNVGTSGGAVRTARFPWTSGSLLASRPTAFNWLGYAAYSTGVYDVFPTNNTSGNGASPRFYYYQTVINTTSTNTTNPFSTNVRSFETRDAFGYNNTQPNIIFDYTVAANTTTFTNTLTVLNNLYIASGATFTQLNSGGASTLTFGNSSTQTPSLRCDGTLTPNNGFNNDLSIVAAFGTTTIAGSAANTTYRIFNLTVNNGATVQAPSSGTVDLGWQFGTITVNSGGILNFVNGSGVVNVTHNASSISAATISVASTGTATFNSFTNSAATNSSVVVANITPNTSSNLSFNNITNNDNNIFRSSSTVASTSFMTIRGNLTNTGSFFTISASNSRILDVTITGSNSIINTDTALTFRGLTIANTGSTTSNSLGVTVTGSIGIIAAVGRTLKINSGARLILDLNTPITLSTTASDTALLQVDGFFRRGPSTISGFSTTSFKINDGGVYEHNFTTTAGVIPTGTWNVGSTCSIIGYSGSGNTYTFGASFSQAFHHFTWNCPSQGQAINLSGLLTTINGNFNLISTGSASTRFTASQNLTLNIAGNLNVSGGSLFFVAFNTTSSTAIFNITGDFNLSGGSVDINTGTNTTVPVINILGNYNQIGGTLAKSSSTCSVNFIKPTGTQTFTQSSGTISNVITWNIGNGTSTTNTLQFLTDANLGAAAFVFNVLNGSGVDFQTFALSGSGTFNVATGSTLTSANTSASGAINTTAVAAGSVRTNTRAFSNTGVNYIFNGAAAQVTGNAIGISSINNLTINNGAGVTLNTAVTVTGTLSLNSGTFTNSTNLTLGNGATINRIAGSLSAVPTFGTTVNVTYSNTAAGLTTDNELPYGPSNATVLNNLTFNSTGSLNVTLKTASGGVQVNGVLALSGASTGSFILNANKLTLAGSSTITRTGSMKINASSASAELNFINTSSLTIPTDATTATVNTLTINGGGVTIGNAITNLTTLNLTSGKLDLSSYDVTITDAGTITGASSSNYIVTSGTGKLKRQIALGGGTFTFPIGRNSTNYSPVTITNTGGSNSTYTVGAATTTFTPINDGANAQWSIASSASTTSTLAFSWFTVDAGTNLNANPTFGRAFQYNGSTWDNRGGTTTSGTTNTTTVTGITNLTNPTWTVAIPPIIPDILLANNVGGQVAAGDIKKSAINNIIYNFQLAVTTENATLNSVSFTTTGTYTGSTDVENFKLYYNTTNNFATATTIGSTLTSSLDAGTHTFSGLTQVINATNTGYLWITTDVKATATSNNTIAVSAITTSDLNF